MQLSYFILLCVVISVFLYKLIRIKKWPNIATFISDGLSVDESKVSLIMLSLIVCIGLSAYSVIANGDIPQNLLYLTIAITSAITGMNLFSLEKREVKIEALIEGNERVEQP